MYISRILEKFLICTYQEFEFLICRPTHQEFEFQKCDPEFLIRQRQLTICHNYFVICTHREFQNSWHVHVANSGINSKTAFHTAATAVHRCGVYRIQSHSSDVVTLSSDYEPTDSQHCTLCIVDSR